MNTLYDTLDVPPNCDLPKIKDAFRRAVKLTHPDLNVDDPEAAARLRLIVRAKTILSDPELRAVYDRMLDFERQQLQQPRSKLISVRDAIYMVVLAAALAGTFTLFTYGLEAPVGKIEVAKDGALVAANVPNAPSQAADKISGDKSQDPAVSEWSTVAANSGAADRDATAPVLSVAPIVNVERETATDTESPSPSDPRGLEISEAAGSLMPNATPQTGSNPIIGDAAPIVTVAPTATTEPNAAIHSDAVTSKLSVKDARFYREQGLAAYRNGDVSRAIADFNRAIRLDPNFKTARIDRGIAFYRLGEFKRAFAEVAEANRLGKSGRRPGSPVAKQSGLPDE